MTRRGAHIRAPAGAPPERELQRPGARLRFRDSGAGPAIVMIHGWTLDLDMWEPQVSALSDAFRIVRLDRRGFGLSSGRPSLAEDTGDILALCEHLQLRSTAVLGMSQGARVAAQLAAEAPGLLACILFDGPPAALLHAGAAVAEEEIPIASYRTLLHSSGIEAFRTQWRRHPLVQLRTGHAPAHELLQRMLDRYPAADLRAAQPDPMPALPPVESMGTPALVISGELDLPGRVRFADALAAALPRCERAIVPDAGHLPNLDNPTFYNALLRRFLQCHAH